MNPFQMNMIDNKEIHEILSKISKKSSTTKIKNLKILQEKIESIDIENIMHEILKVLVPLINVNTEVEVKTLATVILFKIANLYKHNPFIEPIVPKLILTAIEENNKEFLKAYNINNYIDVLLSMVSYESNLIVYYKMLLYTSRYGLKELEVQNILIRDANLYNFDNTIELKYLCAILAAYRNNILIRDAFIDLIKEIRVCNCIPIKWRILVEVFEYFENSLFIKDSKFIDLETLKIIEDANNNDITWDKFEPMNPDVFTYIYKKIDDKSSFLLKYLNQHTKRPENLQFNILEFSNNFEFLNSNVDFDLLNIILKYIVSDKSYSWDKSKSFIGLSEEQKISRAFIIQYTFDHFPEVSVVDSNIEKAVYVFPVKYFADNFDKFKNQDVICRKYPGLVTLNFIKSIIHSKEMLCNYLKDITDPEIQEYIKGYMNNYYKTEDYLYVYDRLGIVTYLETLLCFHLYNIKEIDFGKLDPKIIINQYLNTEFVEYLLLNGKLNLNDFVYELFLILGKLKICNSNFYSHEFYYINSYFYQNMHIMPFDPETHDYLEFIKNILEKIHVKNSKNNSLVFLILILCEVLGAPSPDYEIEITERVINNLVSSQCIYGIKILFHLKDRFLITFDDILEVVNRFELFECEYLDYRLGRNITNEYVNCYINNVSKQKLSQKEISDCLALKNPRLHNFLIEKVTSDDYKDQIKFVFDKETTVTDRLENINVDDRLIIQIQDTNFLTTAAIQNIFNHSLNFQNYTPIINACKSDFAWTMDIAYCKARKRVLNAGLCPIYQIISSEFINIYALTRFEEQANEQEIFDLMTSNINFKSEIENHPNFAWNVFLRSIHLIRNINIIFFLEGMIKNLKFDTSDKELQCLYAFNFPNINTNKQTLGPLIEEEIKHNINGMSVSLLKKTNGYIVKVAYSYDESTFNCKLEIDNFNLKKTNFETSAFKKDLLTIKIRSLLQKCNKFMEILSIWKINIDNKMQGIKECLICYLTVDDNMFPDFECKTCGNKFHKKCLRRWADKSVKFTCPLCRGKFRCKELRL